MKKAIKISILTFFGLLGLVSLNPTSTFAAGGSTGYVDVCNQDVPQGVKDAAGCPGNSNSDLETVIKNVLDAIILIAGLVSVIFVVIGGIQYITSTGDPGKVKKAKDTILYALIGLVICALSYAIVNWAISTLSNGSTPAASSFTSEADCKGAGFNWDGTACN